MRLVIQRVLNAEVVVQGHTTGKIDQGLLILVGVEHEDTKDDIDWLVQKIVSLRIFSDAHQKMNLNIQAVNGSFLVVSQFTLHASTKKGNRPSYIKAAAPDFAKEMIDKFICSLQKVSENKVETGIFGADMKVHLVNDGPVTIIMDSKNKE